MGHHLTVQIVTLPGDSPVLHAALGPYLGTRDVERETGAPVRNTPDKVWCVAFVDGYVAGFAGLELGKRSASLCNAYVRPRFRGHGIYDLLFAARLAEIGAGTKVRATVTEASAGTLRRYGFTEVRQNGRFRVMERVA